MKKQSYENEMSQTLISQKEDETFQRIYGLASKMVEIKKIKALC